MPVNSEWIFPAGLSLLGALIFVWKRLPQPSPVRIKKSCKSR